MDNLNFPDQYKPGKSGKPRATFFYKMYDWEDLIDLSQHIEYAIDPDNSSFRQATGCDEGGEFKGKIRVTMEFVPDNA